MQRAEKGDLLSTTTSNNNDGDGQQVVEQSVYRTISKSFRIKSIEIVDNEYLYDDINLGETLDDDDVFLDKDKELNYVANHFSLTATDTKQNTDDNMAQFPFPKLGEEHVYNDIMQVHESKVESFYQSGSKLEVKKEVWGRRDRSRRISDVIDSLGDEAVNYRRSSESGGIAIASPRSRASSDLGYSGSLSSPAGTAFSFPPPAALHKRLNDVTDSKPINAAIHGEYVAPEARMPVERDAEEYNMYHPRRGRAIIINNDTFDNNFASQRKGSHVDVANLEAAFSDLGFEVTIFDNMTFQEIKKIINEISQEDHTDCDSLMVAVLTHGMDNGLLYARDVLYPVEALWNPFTANNCLTLAGKPKLFFVQACRGDRLDPGVTLVARKGSVSETDTGTAAYKIPSFADFLLSYSSMQGYYSWRNPEDGTWFIQSLVAELKKNGSHMNFLNLMTRVNRRVGVQYSSNNEEVPWLHDQKQVPMFHSTLIRDLVFRPKHHIKLDPVD